MQLVELSARLGALSAVAAGLFAVEGKWAEHMEDDRAVTHLATHSRQHGWHAELLGDLLPDSPSLDARQHLVTPPSWQQALGMVDEAAEAEPALVLVALYRHLVPRHAAAVWDLQRQLTSPSDDAVARSVGFVVSDVSADLLGGSSLLFAAIEKMTALGDTATLERGSGLGNRLDAVFVPT